jgi:hypothetical protein
MHEIFRKNKEILEENRDKLIEFSELLQNSTVIYQKDFFRFISLLICGYNIRIINPIGKNNGS